MKKYVAKPGTWFDAGTEVELVEDVTDDFGLFFGIRNGKPDEEVCEYIEFEITEKDAVAA